MTASMANAITLVQTTINFTMTSPIRVSNGYRIQLAVAYGSFACSILNLLSSLTNFTIVSCSQSQLILQNPTLLSASSSFWITTGFNSPISIVSNTVTLDMNDLDSYSIMSGSASINIGISQPIFTVTNVNSTYTATTDYSFV